MSTLKSFAFAIAVLLAGVAAANAATCVVTSGATGNQCFTLYAGQNINAGSVCVQVNNGSTAPSVNVTYTTTGGWELTEAHLWIGQSLTDMPQTKTGNPIPGKFPYNSGDITGSTSYSFAIPLTNPAINFSCPADPVTYLMAAHASLRKLNPDGLTYQTETGWSDGSPITSRGNWATFSTFTLNCSCTGSVVKCDTAFAKSASASTCFLDLDSSFQRWGWTNGPLAPGNYTFELWAGAGQCDTTKGTLVGTVTFNYPSNSTSATVTYTTTTGWMTETHVYVGTNDLPTFKQGKNTFVETVAPGQYPYIHGSLDDVTTDSFTVSVPSNGLVYVIAHAGTCRYE